MHRPQFPWNFDRDWLYHIIAYKHLCHTLQSDVHCLFHSIFPIGTGHWHSGNTIFSDSTQMLQKADQRTPRTLAHLWTTCTKTAAWGQRWHSTEKHWRYEKNSTPCQQCRGCFLLRQLGILRWEQIWGNDQGLPRSPLKHMQLFGSSKKEQRTWPWAVTPHSTIVDGRAWIPGYKKL